MKRITIAPLISLSALTLAQTQQQAGPSLISKCFANPQWKFCAPKDDIPVIAEVGDLASGRGTCCPSDSTFALCEDSGTPFEGIQCTKPAPASGLMTPAESALYFTYAVGMREMYEDVCSTNIQSSPIYYPGE